MRTGEVDICHDLPSCLGEWGYPISVLKVWCHHTPESIWLIEIFGSAGDVSGSEDTSHRRARKTGGLVKQMVDLQEQILRKLE